MREVYPGMYGREGTRVGIAHPSLPVPALLCASFLPSSLSSGVFSEKCLASSKEEKKERPDAGCRPRDESYRIIFHILYYSQDFTGLRPASVQI